MKPQTTRNLGRGLLITAGALLALSGAALADDPAPAAAVAAAAAAAPTPNPGDTAWMLTSSALVLMMSIPGLALFYGGLVRTKNMLSVLTQVFMIVSLVGILWALYGYSIALGGGDASGPYLGDWSKAFLKGITPDSNVSTFTPGHVIPEYAYMVFQMTFAMITPALICGAFAERMKFSTVFLFMALWVTFVYFPIAHWVWGIADPSVVTKAATAWATAAADKKDEAKKALDVITGAAGWLGGGNASWLGGTGALDFAGGTVVHINAGIAGLVCALMLGKRAGLGKEAMPPHSLTMTMIGASLLWVGWFGFNAGSNLEANGTTALAFVNTMLATCAAGLSWMLVEWALKGKPSLLGLVTGAVAGLVAVTPASGFAGPMGSIVLGLMVSPICIFFCTTIKNMLGYDDALDVFGVHCIGGITGALMTGILVNSDLGGVGITDYTRVVIDGKCYIDGAVKALKEGQTAAAACGGDYSMVPQMIAQLSAVLTTLIWSGLGTAVILTLLKFSIGLRPAEEKEREGLDISDHGERAYNY